MRLAFWFIAKHAKGFAAHIQHLYQTPYVAMRNVTGGCELTRQHHARHTCKKQRHGAHTVTGAAGSATEKRAAAGDRLSRCAARVAAPPTRTSPKCRCAGASWKSSPVGWPATLPVDLLCKL